MLYYEKSEHHTQRVKIRLFIILLTPAACVPSIICSASYVFHTMVRFVVMLSVLLRVKLEVMLQIHLPPKMAATSPHLLKCQVQGCETDSI